MIFFGEKQGEEKTPTFFLHRKTDRPYHIDYDFVSKPLMDCGNHEVGDPDQRLDVSDHMPIVFTIGVDSKQAPFL